MERRPGTPAGVASRTRDVLELAQESGFDLVGVAPLRTPVDAQRFRDWLDAGRQGSMAWLARQRERIVDPTRILPAGKSVLVVGLAHGRSAGELHGGGRIARYALGRDYHNVLGKRLRRFARRLREFGLLRRTRTIVDAGPLLERSHAAEAGVGFPSKAANLLHRRLGPWFFLGELLLEDELEPTPQRALGSCGTCRACLDACPTQAILEPGLVDARLCLSYHTIENRGEIPREIDVGPWAFGCDVCSEVCPWGRRTPDTAKTWGTTPALEQWSLVDLLERSREEFSQAFAGSPVLRAKRSGMARNAALALASVPSDAGAQALARAVARESDAAVRGAAVRSLGRAYRGEPTAREALERARGRETDSQVQRELQDALDGCP